MINRIAGISLKRHRSDGDEQGLPSFGVQDIKKFVEPVEGLIVKNPAAAVAAAFVVGVALAWWIKRSK
jgi:hypothetical protein